MTSETIGFWLATSAAVISAAYSALTYHAPRGATGGDRSSSFPTRRTVLAFVLPIAAWLAVGFDYYDRHHQPPPPPFVIVTGWGATSDGVHPPVYTASVLTVGVQSYSKTKYLLLIARNNWANRDPLNDTEIEKSVAYTIAPEPLTMQMNGTGKVKFAANAVNAIQFAIVLMPDDVTPEEITKLADVQKRGGQVLTTVGQNIVAGAPLSAPAPPQSGAP